MKTILFLALVTWSWTLQAQSGQTDNRDTVSSMKEGIRMFIQNQHVMGTKRRIIADTIWIPAAGNFTLDISRFGYTNKGSMNIQYSVVGSVAMVDVRLSKDYTTSLLPFNFLSTLGVALGAAGLGFLVHVRIDGY